MDSSTWSDAQALAYIASYADLRRVFGADPVAGRTHYAQAGSAEGRVISFDALSYLASYSDLIAAFKSDSIAATRHFIQTGATEGRTVTFDGMAYLASYADLRAAFGIDPVAATQHFVGSGAAEGRAVTFDAFGYLASYADLRAAFGTDASAAIRHFVGTGATEGRAVSFDALSYIASYSDLITAFGADTAAATRHFVGSGAAEGRAVSFDGLAYIASYSDLRAAFGTNADAGTRHFIETGAGEGRTVSFDAVAHLLSQPDLIAAGLGVRGALRHWINYGANEGRSASGSFGDEQASHQLQAGDAVGGSIDRSGDSDWFRIDLAAGEGVTFDLTLSNGTGVLSIRDADGRALPAGEVSGSQTSFMAPKSGAYYIVLSAAGSAVGTYSLTAKDYFTFTGTFGPDTLTGTEGADLIRGLDGSDTLNGRGGNDVLEGGAGSDTLDGGLGDDVLYGNNAANTGFDFSYDSLFDSQGGNDQLFGQDGGDYLSVSRHSFNGNLAASTVLLDGGAGDDQIYFSASSRHLDTVTVRGGIGNDTISVGSVLKSTIDAGDGNDKVTIGMTGGDQTITLGAGADVLTLDGFPSTFAIGSPTVITDFQVGADTLSLDQYLANTLQGWDKATNPFATGHLKLIQSGVDTSLQLDRDGNVSNGYGLATLLTFANTSAASFTARELGYAPDGSAEPGQTITGTFGPDTLTGTEGADLIRGLDGSDTLYGRGGNDVLEGGAGADTLDGGLGDDVLYGNNAANSGYDYAHDYLSDSQGGNDQLFGQDGADYLWISRYDNVAASAVLLDGGTGDDNINFHSHNRHLDTVTIRAGMGNDTIRVGSVLRGTIDAGEGNDTVTIGMAGGDQTITLGAGADILTLEGNTFSIAIGNPTLITDFQIGADVLSLDQYLAATLLGWDKAANPFGTGHLKLVQSGSDTLLQLDRDGNVSSGYGLATLLTFADTSAASFTARELGDAPDGSAAIGQTITGTFGADTLMGTNGADLIRGFDGGDTLYGRGGNDVLEGGSGADTLDGGLGDDVLYGNTAANSGYDHSYDYLSDSQGGNDQLFGQDGNDYLSVSRHNFYSGDNIAASTVLLDGGSGDDDLNFYSSNRHLDTVTMRGGTGNDRINVGSVLKSTIDAGDGNDMVIIETSGGDQTVTLGMGADTLTLSSNAHVFAIGNPIRVTDFQTGADRLSMDQYLSNTLQSWDKATSPFATGHLKLVQSGADTLLQLDRDGSAGSSYDLSTLIIFDNTNASSFTARELGYAPASGALMAAADDMTLAIRLAIKSISSYSAEAIQ